MWWIFTISINLCFHLAYGGRGRNFFVLYNPRDISTECAFSYHLKYDISYGMGLSDTMTVVMRTLSETDYECLIEFVAENEDVSIMTVIQYPTSIGYNCYSNKEAFAIYNAGTYVLVCSVLSEDALRTQYFLVLADGRIRLRFLSNSSINIDMNSYKYQVTATAARVTTEEAGCMSKNETDCKVHDIPLCITNGVVCDGIKNCGYSNWYDERRSQCAVQSQRVGLYPMLTVLGIIICGVLIASHFLSKFLPPTNNVFFLFNTSGDNRLCIDPVYNARKTDDETHVTPSHRAVSLIPLSESSSSTSNDDPNSVNLPMLDDSPSDDNGSELAHRNTLKDMTKMLQKRLRTVTGIKKTNMSVRIKSETYPGFSSTSMKSNPYATEDHDQEQSP